MKEIPAKQRTPRRGKRACSDAMLTAIFGALADFAETPDKKLSAIIRAGKIAEAFCSTVTGHPTELGTIGDEDLARTRPSTAMEMDVSQSPRRQVIPEILC